jgi:hypothetical protein
MLTPITLTPVAGNGKRFYRAVGEAKGAETLERLGVAQAFDFGGCGPPQPPKSTRLAFEVDVV